MGGGGGSGIQVKFQSNGTKPHSSKARRHAIVRGEGFTTVDVPPSLTFPVSVPPLYPPLPNGPPRHRLPFMDVLPTNRPRPVGVGSKIPKGLLRDGVTCK